MNRVLKLATQNIKTCLVNQLNFRYIVGAVHNFSLRTWESSNLKSWFFYKMDIVNVFCTFLEWRTLAHFCTFLFGKIVKGRRRTTGVIWVLELVLVKKVKGRRSSTEAPRCLRICFFFGEIKRGQIPTESLNRTPTWFGTIDSVYVTRGLF